MNCPSIDEIRNCLLGQDTVDQNEQIFGHAENCAQCASIIEQLDSEPDAIGLALSDVASALPSEIEPACSKMISRASELFGTDMAKPAQTDLTGRSLRDYELKKIVGVGGMGTVYLAWHNRLKRHVALKVLSNSVAHSAREMEAVGRLNHPHIVRALDAGVENGTHYLVMDLMNGVDAGEVVRQLGPLPVPEACQIIEHAARGLDYAHHNGIVHRDVKPSNIMVTESDKSLLMDLGLALTDTNTEAQIAGTVHYMSPEQSIAGQATSKSDVYSLGCTFYHLLAGHPPFGELEKSGADVATILEAHKSSFPKSIATIRTMVPEDIVGIMHRMMSKSASSRPELRKVIEQLAPFAEGAELGHLIKSLKPQAIGGETACSYSYTFRESSEPAELSSHSDIWKYVAAVLLSILMLAALRYSPWSSEARQSDLRPPEFSKNQSSTETNFNGASFDFGELEKLLNEALPSDELVLSFVSATSGDRRFEITHAPGESIRCDVYQPADSNEKRRSIEAWDLLELKLKAPDIFAKLKQIWIAARKLQPDSRSVKDETDVSSNAEQIKILKLLSTYHPNESTTKVSGVWLGEPFRAILNKAGKFVAANYATTPPTNIVGTQSVSSTDLPESPPEIWKFVKSLANSGK